MRYSFFPSWALRLGLNWLPGRCLCREASREFFLIRSRICEPFCRASTFGFLKCQEAGRRFIKTACLVYAGHQCDFASLGCICRVPEMMGDSPHSLRLVTRASNVKLEGVDLVLAVGAGLDGPGGGDFVARAGQGTGSEAGADVYGG